MCKNKSYKLENAGTAKYRTNTNIIFTLGINNPEGFGKHYATQCKEAGTAVSRPPGQSCHVVKLH